LPLKVVADEYGSPTFTQDLAEAIAELLGSGDIRGVHHIVNAGVASRATWARELFRQAGVDVDIEEIPSSAWERASTPPAWGVLEPSAIPGVEPLRPWQEAIADYLPILRRQRAAIASR
jgi:dTDP-4-dehydrorhamnose reductase